MTELRVIENNEVPATSDQIAALEFTSVRRLAALSEKQRLESLHALSDDVRAMAILGMNMLVRDKRDVIDLVSAKYDTFGPMLMMLAETRERGQALLDVIGAAEARLAVALAVVEAKFQD